MSDMEQDVRHTLERLIAARGVTGEVACYDPGENVHKNGILHTTTVPAQITEAQRTDAALGDAQWFSTTGTAAHGNSDLMPGAASCKLQAASCKI